MSIFKTSGIILKAEKKLDKDFVYTIFTSDYGKIKASKKLSKKEKILDLGYIINFEIEVKKDVNIHKIKNIKIKSEFLNKDKSFSVINNYLILLANIEKNMSFGVENKDVFKLIEIINKKENITKQNLLLSRAKFKHILGELPNSHQNGIIQKILKFIIKSDIKTILRLQDMNEELEKILEKIL